MLFIYSIIANIQKIKIFSTIMYLWGGGGGSTQYKCKTVINGVLVYWALHSYVHVAPIFILNFAESQVSLHRNNCTEIPYAEITASGQIEWSLALFWRL